METFSETATPVVKMVSITASASVGQVIDLEKLAKSSPGSAYNPSVNPSFLNYRLRDNSGIAILGPGKVVYLHARSEEEARTAIQGAFLELSEKKVLAPTDPQISVDHIEATVYFRRGVEIQSLPEQIPNSLYVRKIGDFVQGTYNKEGTPLKLTSREDALRAVGEITDMPASHLLPGTNPLTSNFTHFGYCRFKGRSFAKMFRGDDTDGKMLMTGQADIMFAKSEAEVRELAGSLEAMLKAKNLLGPLTPLDKLPQGGRDFPRLYDHFAEEPGVWGGSGAKGIGAGWVPPVVVPSGFDLPNRICYNCLRVPVAWDGLSWVAKEWWKPFRDSAPHFVKIGQPPRTVWICPECDRCVVCGAKRTMDAPLRSQALVHESRISSVVFYCKDHDAMRVQSAGVVYKKVPKPLKGAWTAYLAYQTDRLSTLNTPQSKERLDVVKGLMKQVK